MKNVILTALFLVAPSSFASNLVCVDDSVQIDSAFAATFNEDNTAVALSIPTGESSSFVADAECAPNDALQAIRCDVETEKHGDFTVILATRDDQHIASVAPAMSMEIPTFLPCKAQ